MKGSGAILALQLADSGIVPKTPLLPPPPALPRPPTPPPAPARPKMPLQVAVAVPMPVGTMPVPPSAVLLRATIRHGRPTQHGS
eukprot:12796969-Prorocentrum_lima.AAC.1